MFDVGLSFDGPVDVCLEIIEASQVFEWVEIWDEILDIGLSFLTHLQADVWHIYLIDYPFSEAVLSPRTWLELCLF